MMIAASVIAGATANAVRFATGRARPALNVPDAWHGPSLAYKYNSFPSGHTAASAGFFAALAFAEWPVGALAMAVPLIIGLSRLCVLAHHLSDVVASVLVGLGAAYIVHRFAMKRTNSPAQFLADRLLKP